MEAAGAVGTADGGRGGEGRDGGVVVVEEEDSFVDVLKARGVEVRELSSWAERLGEEEGVWERAQEWFTSRDVLTEKTVGFLNEQVTNTCYLHAPKALKVLQQGPVGFQRTDSYPRLLRPEH